MLAGWQKALATVVSQDRPAVRRSGAVVVRHWLLDWLALRVEAVEVREQAVHLAGKLFVGKAFRRPAQLVERSPRRNLQIEMTLPEIWVRFGVALHPRNRGDRADGCQDGEKGRNADTRSGRVSLTPWLDG
jgi:hypothetical protein